MALHPDERARQIEMNDKLDALIRHVLRLTRLVEGRETVSEIAINELKQSGRCPVLSAPPNGGCGG